MIRFIVFMLLMLTATELAYAQRPNLFSRQRVPDQYSLDGYATPTAKVAPPTKKEIEEHFLTFVSEEKPEDLPLEMELNRKPAHWGNIKYVPEAKFLSRLRYLTSMDVIVIVVGSIIVIFLTVWFIGRDIARSFYEQGFRDATFTKIEGILKTERNRFVDGEGKTREIDVVYVDGDVFNEIVAKTFKKSL